MRMDILLISQVILILLPNFMLIFMASCILNGFYCQFCTGFLSTLPAPPGSPFHEMLAVDCEMVNQSLSLWFNKITVDDNIDELSLFCQ